jgi:hypothetical protein
MPVKNGGDFMKLRIKIVGLKLLKAWAKFSMKVHAANRDFEAYKKAHEIYQRADLEIGKLLARELFKDFNKYLSTKEVKSGRNNLRRAHRMRMVQNENDGNSFNQEARRRRDCLYGLVSAMQGAARIESRRIDA